MVNAVTVANELIRLGKRDDRTFTPMQLLKLVYIAHGWMLGFFSKPLINDDIEAWKYGPVIPNLYHKIKDYRNSPVTHLIKQFPWDTFQGNNNLSEEERSVINFVYKQYGGIGGIDLSMITHQNDTPWSQVFSHEGWGDRITDDIIEPHYRHLAQEVLRQQNHEPR